MSNHDHLVELGGFEEKVGVLLEVHLGARLSHRLLHQGVVRLGQHHAGKQVGDDALEQRHVLGEELAQVHVDDGPEHQDVFVLIRKPSLEVTRRAKHRHHRAHAVIVVVLGGELLGAELVALHDLRGAVAGLEVTERVEDDLADHGVVRDHHRDGSEERLEVIGELGATRVTGVHGDGTPGAVLEANLGTLEDEAGHPRGDRALDVEHLLRHHREHLEVDAVKLIEARPRTRRRKTLEKLAHLDVVHRVGAVKHDALPGESLGEVLRGLRLARTRGSLGRSSHRQVNRTHQSAVTPVRQRGNHQTRRVTEVLVPVLNLRGHDSHDRREVPGAGCVLLPVRPQLRLPVEIGGGTHLVLGQVRNHVARVDVHDHERAERLTLQRRELAAHAIDDFHEIAGAPLLVFAHRAGTVGDGLGDLLSPEHRRDDEDDHTRPVEHPLVPRLGSVGRDTLAGDVRDVVEHRSLHLQQPLLNRAVGLLNRDDFLEGNLLLLLGDHREDVVLLVAVLAVRELELGDALEALLEMGLNLGGILCLG